MPRQRTHRPEGINLSAHDLKITHYNTDRQANKSLPHIMAYAQSQKSNILCLNETNNLRLDKTYISRRGYNLYRHPTGKVAMLIDMDTVEVHARSSPPQCNAPLDLETSHAWYSDDFDSMSITLDTSEGPLLIASSYLPTGKSLSPHTKSCTNDDTSKY
jgi:hypothetical protein